MLSKEHARLHAQKIRSQLSHDQSAYALKFKSVFETHFNYSALGTLSFYWPLKSEADPRAIAHKFFEISNSSIYLPIIQNGNRELGFCKWTPETKLVKGPSNILIPDNSGQEQYNDLPDTLIVPLLGVNHSGQRIGFGKGHYDATIAHILKHCNKLPLTIGLAYNEQVFDFEWDINAYDMPLSYAVTPTKLYKFI